MNIAIFTPNKNPYSETFIQAHKNYLKGNIFYYYGGLGNIKLENGNIDFNTFKQFFLKGLRKILKKPSSYVWSKPVLKSLKKNKIDAILVEYGTHASDLMSVLQKVDSKVIVHFHGFDACRYDIIKKYNHYKDVFYRADTIIGVSKVMCQKLLDLGCPKDKLVYNVYGPQPEFHDVQPSFSKKQFIGIGRFTYKKAPYYTILAFKKVLESYPEAKLLLAGNGALLPICEDLVKYYDIDKSVKFLGVVSPEQYQKLLSESMAFVQHSITAKNGDMEGTPLAVLEASAAGLPVISTYHAGIQDVIVHNKTGLLCDEHDVESMANNMINVMKDIEFAKTLGNNGKMLVRTKYSLERHINQLQEILDKSE